MDYENVFYNTESTKVGYNESSTLLETFYIVISLKIMSPASLAAKMPS